MSSPYFPMGLVRKLNCSQVGSFISRDPTVFMIWRVICSLQLLMVPLLFFISALPLALNEIWKTEYLKSLKLAEQGMWKASIYL